MEWRSESIGCFAGLRAMHVMDPETLRELRADLDRCRDSSLRLGNAIKYAEACLLDVLARTEGVARCIRDGTPPSDGAVAALDAAIEIASAAKRTLRAATLASKEQADLARAAIMGESA